MKQLQLLLTLAVCCALTSCFKDEPLNAEADIEQAWVSLDNPGDLFFNKTDTLVNVVSTQTEIVFNVKDDADLSAVAPEFKITEGTTISPENGSTHDFSNGQTVQYTVTSQDGQWKRTYNVKFSSNYNVTHYSFENYHTAILNDNFTDFPYYEWTETGYDNESYWASGNGAYTFNMRIAAGKTSLTPEECPTYVINNGVSGHAVELKTLYTSALGAMVKMPIAAGNLYVGKFGDISMSQSAALKATMFGRPFNRKPLRLSGWYKYKPGEKYTDDSYKEVEGATDTGDIYAVMYRNEDSQGNAVMLYGDDVLTNENIVAIARIDETKVTSEWTYFEADFVYSKELDTTLLENKGYNLTIVATSSKDGAFFKGAVGSTLDIDEFEITCEGDLTETNK